MADKVWARLKARQKLIINSNVLLINAMKETNLVPPPKPYLGLVVSRLPLNIRDWKEGRE